MNNIQLFYLTSSISFSYIFFVSSFLYSNRIIGGYLFGSLNNEQICFVVENDEEILSGFALIIIQSEKYDKIIQDKWLEELHRKYPTVDQVNSHTHPKQFDLLC